MNIVVLYHIPLVKSASTIHEHVGSFKRYMKNDNVFLLNTEYGFPKKIDKIEFDVIILHYSLFGLGYKYMLNQKFLDMLKRTDAYKVAFFQDEYHYCPKRLQFLNDYEIDSIFTLLDQKYFPEVYGKHTKVKSIYTTYTGYVENDLVETAKKFYIPIERRGIDISYRARELPYYMGREAQEKTEIAKEVLKRLKDSEYRLDIAYDEHSRLYGDDWFRLLANSRAVLGVEAGVSIFDLDGSAQRTYAEAVRKNPGMGKEEIFSLLEPWEGKIHYRTISPRIFEAAAFRVCQILFEGEYQGVIEPMVHYIPLKKDFSNFDDVMKMLDDRELVGRIVDRAYGDLIESGRYSYRSFIEFFASTLPRRAPGDRRSAEEIRKLLDEDLAVRKAFASVKALRYRRFPGRATLAKAVKKILRYKGTV